MDFTSKTGCAAPRKFLIKFSSFNQVCRSTTRGRNPTLFIECAIELEGKQFADIITMI